MFNFKRVKTFTVTLYMKSGNVIRIDRVTDFEWNETTNSKKLKIIQYKPRVLFRVSAVCIEQIEAITTEG